MLEENPLASSFGLLAEFSSRDGRTAVSIPLAGS